MEIEPQQLLPRGMAGDRQRAWGCRRDIYFVARSTASRDAFTDQLQLAGAQVGCKCVTYLLINEDYFYCSDLCISICG